MLAVLEVYLAAIPPRQTRGFFLCLAFSLPERQTPTLHNPAG